MNGRIFDFFYGALWGFNPAHKNLEMAMEQFEERPLILTRLRTLQMNRITYSKHGAENLSKMRSERKNILIESEEEIEEVLRVAHE